MVHPHGVAAAVDQHWLRGRERGAEPQRARCISRAPQQRAPRSAHAQRPAAPGMQPRSRDHAAAWRMDRRRRCRRTLRSSPAPSSLSSAQNPAKCATEAGRKSGLVVHRGASLAACVASRSRSAAGRPGKSAIRRRVGSRAAATSAASGAPSQRKPPSSWSRPRQSRTVQKPVGRGSAGGPAASVEWAVATEGVGATLQAKLETQVARAAASPGGRWRQAPLRAGHAARQAGASASNSTRCDTQHCRAKAPGEAPEARLDKVQASRSSLRSVGTIAAAGIDSPAILDVPRGP